MQFGGFPRPIPDEAASSSIKSRQSGTSTYLTQNNTIPISPVDLKRSIVRISYTISAAASAVEFFLMARFTSNSQISIECDSTTNNSATKVVTWEVIEFNNVKSLQSGQVVNTGTGGINTATAPISPVNTAKCSLFFSLRSTCGATTLPFGLARGEVINSTTLGFTVNNNVSAAVATFQYYLVEFL